MSSQEENSGNSGENSEIVGSKEESSVDAGVNQPDLQIEGAAAQPLLLPSSPQSCSSSSVGGQGPGQAPDRNYELIARKVMNDLANFMYALSKQVYIAGNNKSGDGRQGDGADGEFQFVTEEMKKESRKWIKENWANMSLEEQQEVAKLPVDKQAEFLFGQQQQVGGNGCTQARGNGCTQACGQQ